MNSFWLAVTVGVIALCCSQLVCADIKTINEYLDAKVEPINDDNLDNGISALRELRDKKSKAVHTKLVGSLTNDLIDEMLEAASWIEQKKCGHYETEHSFDSSLRDEGSANRLLINILDKKDVTCAKDVAEREQLRYISLDSTQTAKIGQLEQLTLNELERSVFAGKEQYKGDDLIWRAASRYTLTKDLLNWAFLDSLLAYLETETQKERCQFVGEEVKGLIEEHIISPCKYFIHETKDIFANYQEDFKFMIHFKDDKPMPRVSFKLIDNLDFYHHLMGYKVCRFINGEQKSILIQDLADELKTQCIKKMYPE